MSRTHQIIQRTSESSLSIAADRLMDTDGDGEALTAQRQTVRRFVQKKKKRSKQREFSPFNVLTLYRQFKNLKLSISVSLAH